MSDNDKPSHKASGNWFSRHPNETSLLVILAILLIGATLGSVKTTATGTRSLFASPENARLLTEQMGMLGIIAIGAGIVIITGGIDLTIGAMISLLGTFFFLMLTDWGRIIIDNGIPWHWSFAVLIIILSGAGLGLWHAYGITRLKMQPFIVTLCGLLSYRGIARFFSGDAQVGKTDLHEKMDTGLLTVLTEGKVQTLINYMTGGDKQDGFLAYLPLSFVYLCIIAAITGVFLHRSIYGRYIFAVGRNELATRYSGINTNKVIGSAYIICGLCTAISSILYAGFAGAVMPNAHGSFYELYAIAAAVLGGCSLRGGEGSIFGIVLGTAILAVLQNIVQLFRDDTSLSDTIIGVILFVAVAMMMKKKSFSFAGLLKLFKKNA